MADIATFACRESVVHAAIQELEKEGIDISLPSSKNVSLPDTEEVSVSVSFKQRCLVFSVLRKEPGHFNI